MPVILKRYRNKALGEEKSYIENASRFPLQCLTLTPIDRHWYATI